jgi:hypothetical protein
MSDQQPSYLPRPGDLPREQLALLAAKAIAENGGPERAKALFKFTCQWCGQRCTLNEPNMLYEFGECCVCHKETKIDVGGFSLQLTLCTKTKI